MKCRCGFENAVEAKFCGECGSAIEAAGAGPTMPMASTQIPTATGTRTAAGRRVSRAMLVIGGVVMVVAAAGYWWLNRPPDRYQPDNSSLYPIKVDGKNERVAAQGRQGELDASADMASEPGVYLVLRVQTDDALRLWVETASDRLCADLERAGVTGVTATATTPTKFEVGGVSPTQEALFRQTATVLEGSFISQGGAGNKYSFELKPDVAVGVRNAAVSQAQGTIERRLRELGLTKAVVIRQGVANGDLLRVSIPGRTDIARAKEVIRSTALFELKFVEGGPAPARDTLLRQTNGQAPRGLEVAPGPQGTYYLVQKTPVVTGGDLLDAQPILDDNNQPAVRFLLNANGTRKFSEATSGKTGRLLAIVLDGRVWSVSRVADSGFSEGRIAGGLTEQDARDLSLVLRSGALPASMTYLEEGVIQPTTTGK